MSLSVEKTIVILILGETGVGKSTFINNLLGEANRAPVGHNLQSTTTTLKGYDLPDRNVRLDRIVLVDTPGFNNDQTEDDEVWKDIIIWLQSLPTDTLVCSPLYIQDVSQYNPRLRISLNHIQRTWITGNLHISFSASKPANPQSFARFIKTLREDLSQDPNLSKITFNTNHDQLISINSTQDQLKVLLDAVLEKPSINVALLLQELEPIFNLARSKTPQLVILVIGETGVGKSTFINNVLGTPEAPVGHSLKCRTQTVQEYAYLHPSGKTIHLVDTPGFNDSFSQDVIVLDKIRKWFKRPDLVSTHLLGILYLHDIAQPRFTSPPLTMTPKRLTHSSLSPLVHIAFTASRPITPQTFINHTGELQTLITGSAFTTVESADAEEPGSLSSSDASDSPTSPDSSSNGSSFPTSPSFTESTSPLLSTSPILATSSPASPIPKSTSPKPTLPTSTRPSPLASYPTSPSSILTPTSTSTARTLISTILHHGTSHSIPISLLLKELSTIAGSVSHSSSNGNGKGLGLVGVAPAALGALSYLFCVPI
ncbi:hypothetical protein FA15DRAFT_674003 [Coprinopsis marcescibilis]|uniref:G domain-containing protein n=1 Tax=Coprinopsis marcescibilis TaxID=230819 RepID=A0A5C3KIF1_COPMA|nr:hypothetical protein FA15DRAFT_674003 [Coprinopsis marcescibilis]